MKALVGAFNQENALVGAFSVIVQHHRLIHLRHYSKLMSQWCDSLELSQNLDLINPSHIVKKMLKAMVHVP